MRPHHYHRLLYKYIIISFAFQTEGDFDWFWLIHSNIIKELRLFFA